jgi:hypothetical protein
MKSNLNMKYKKENVELRQGAVYELHCLGYNQRDIAKRLNVSLGLVNSDLRIVLAQKQNIVNEYNKKLPQEIDKAFSIYNTMIRLAHCTIENTRDESVKLKGIDSIRSITEARIQLASNFDIIKHVPNLNKKDENIVPAKEQEEDQK